MIPTQFSKTNFISWFYVWKTKKRVSKLFANLEIEQSWSSLNAEYKEYYDKYPGPRMQRGELSFHSEVRLLGYLLELLGKHVLGDNLEIGIWKGISLSFIEKHSYTGVSVGVDLCAFQFQIDELQYFQKEFFPDAILIPLSSEYAFSEVERHASSFKLIHIDGGHEYHRVRQDFIIWSKSLSRGGFLVFDDFNDPSSPEVRKAVLDLLIEGCFSDFHILGQFNEFPNSFVLSKK